MDINEYLKGENIPTEGEIEAEDANEKEKETPSQSPSEEKPTEETPKTQDGEDEEPDEEEEQKPLHKQKRWQKVYADLKKTREENAALKASIDERFKTVENKIPVPQGQLPERFVKLFGDNPEAYRLWKEEQDELKNSIITGIKTQQEQEKAQEQERIEQGRAYVDEQLENLHNEGLVFDDNELQKFMLDTKEKYGMMPKDEDDNIDFRRGLELMNEMKRDKIEEEKQKSIDRKKIADFTTSSGKRNTTAPKKDYLTSQDIQKMDWDNILND